MARALPLGGLDARPQSIPEGRGQVKNSRPVRLLSLVSKVMERVQSGQLKEYLQGYSSDRHSQKKWNKALDKPLDARAAALKPGHRLWTKVCWPSGNLSALRGLPLGFYRAIQQTKEVHIWVHVFLYTSPFLWELLYLCYVIDCIFALIFICTYVCLNMCMYIWVFSLDCDMCVCVFKCLCKSIHVCVCVFK